MSKLIKQMQMDSLKQTFGETRDMVFLSIKGLPSTQETQLRLSLRKKNIRLHQVKNSLAVRVLKDLGFHGPMDDVFKLPTTIAWGSTSIADLSKTLDDVIKKNVKTITPKGAAADGQMVTFDQAKKFPTRAGALARVAGLILSPAARVAGQIKGPAASVAAQIKTIAEKKDEGAAPAPAAG
jgi:large subunit ribosomal protein L10